jgi:hypothetical protein
LGRHELLLPTCKEQLEELAPNGYVNERNLGKIGTPVTRGILMGNPLSWLILTLSQGYAADKAWAVVHPRVSRKTRNRTYRVCGDDLAAWWPAGVRLEYERRMTTLGYRFSRPKHFVSKVGGVFTEVLYLSTPVKDLSFPLRQTRWTVRAPRSFSEAASSRCDREGTIRVLEHRRKERFSIHGVRFLRTVPLKLFLPSAGVQLPRWSMVGPGCLELAKHCDPEVVYHLGSAAFAKLGPLMRSGGIVPEAPRSLGGTDLPWCATSNRACKPFRKVAAALATGAGGTDTSVLSRPWSVFAASDWVGLAATMMDEPQFRCPRGDLQRGRSYQTDFLGWYPRDKLPLGTESTAEPLSAWKTRSLRDYATMLKAQLGPDPGASGPRGPKLQSLLRSLRTRISDLRGSAHWANPGRDWRKLDLKLRERKEAYLVPACSRHFVGKDRTALAGIQHPAGRRAAYASLGWSDLYSG